MDIKEKSILGENAYSHWYYVSKGLALRRFINNIRFKNILDVGAGSGIFSKQLLKNTMAMEATCLDIGYEGKSEEEYCNKKINFTRNISQSDADIVLFMDVLDHVEDDVLFVKGYVDKVRKGTYFIITVPAFQFLFSEHDRFLGHFRRYNIKTVEACLSKVGLTVLKSNYFFFFVLLCAIPVRMIKKVGDRLFPNSVYTASDLQKRGRFVNSFLTMINRLELLFFSKNRIAGLSIFSLAVKK